MVKTFAIQFTSCAYQLFDIVLMLYINTPYICIWHCSPRSVPIYGLCVSNKSQVFVCHKGQPVIQVWDIAKETLKAQIDVSSLVG